MGQERTGFVGTIMEVWGGSVAPLSRSSRPARGWDGREEVDQGDTVIVWDLVEP